MLLFKTLLLIKLSSKPQPQKLGNPLHFSKSEPLIEKIPPNANLKP